MKNNLKYIILEIILLFLFEKSLLAFDSSTGIGIKYLGGDDLTNESTAEGICNHELIGFMTLGCLSLAPGDEVTKVESNGNIYYTSGISNFNQSSSAQLKTPPFKEPIRASLMNIINGKEEVFGGLTEIEPQSGVFVSAAHVLKAHGIDLFNSELKLNQLKANYFGFLNSQNEMLDDIIFIQLLSTKNEKPSIINPQIVISNWLSKNSIFNNKIESLNGQNWLSWSFVNSDSKNAKKNFLEGIINSISSDNNYLIFNKSQTSNLFGRASSGSVIWGVDERQPIGLGLVQCVESSSKDIYALAILTLSNKSIVEINDRLFQSIIKNFDPTTLKTWPNSCIPIDGRGAGGALTDANLNE